MYPYQYLVFCTLISTSLVLISGQYYDIASNSLYQYPQITNTDDQFYRKLHKNFQQEKVKLQLYYECLCPDCREFDVNQFAPVVEKLSNYLDVNVYPYGNAKTIVHQDGSYEIKCQHGPAECYGNKLHACAIDKLQNITKAIEFNTCMMEPSQNNKGSDDEAADKCGQRLCIDTESIKSCAASQRGTDLLKYYGDETKKVRFDGVPYILINGVPNSGDNLMQDVCAAYNNPPKECSGFW